MGKVFVEGKAYSSIQEAKDKGAKFPEKKQNVVYVSSRTANIISEASKTDKNLYQATSKDNLAVFNANKRQSYKVEQIPQQIENQNKPITKEILYPSQIRETQKYTDSTGNIITGSQIRENLKSNNYGVGFGTDSQGNALLKVRGKEGQFESLQQYDKRTKQEQRFIPIYRESSIIPKQELSGYYDTEKKQSIPLSLKQEIELKQNAEKRQEFFKQGNFLLLKDIQEKQLKSNAEIKGYRSSLMVRPTNIKKSSKISDYFFLKNPEINKEYTKMNIKYSKSILKKFLPYSNNGKIETPFLIKGVSETTKSFYTDAKSGFKGKFFEYATPIGTGAGIGFFSKASPYLSSSKSLFANSLNIAGKGFVGILGYKGLEDIYKQQREVYYSSIPEQNFDINQQTFINKNIKDLTLFSGGYVAGSKATSKGLKSYFFNKESKFLKSLEKEPIQQGFNYNAILGKEGRKQLFSYTKSLEAKQISELGLNPSKPISSIYDKYKTTETKPKTSFFKKISNSIKKSVYYNKIQNIKTSRTDFLKGSEYFNPEKTTKIGLSYSDFQSKIKNEISLIGESQTIKKYNLEKRSIGIDKTKQTSLLSSDKNSLLTYSYIKDSSFSKKFNLIEFSKFEKAISEKKPIYFNDIKKNIDLGIKQYQLNKEFIDKKNIIKGSRKPKQKVKVKQLFLNDRKGSYGGLSLEKVSSEIKPFESSFKTEFRIKTDYTENIKSVFKSISKSQSEIKPLSYIGSKPKIINSEKQKSSFKLNLDIFSSNINKPKLNLKLENQIYNKANYLNEIKPISNTIYTPASISIPKISTFKPISKITDNLKIEKYNIFKPYEKIEKIPPIEPPPKIIVPFGLGLDLGGSLRQRSSSSFFKQGNKAKYTATLVGKIFNIRAKTKSPLTSGINIRGI